VTWKINLSTAITYTDADANTPTDFLRAYISRVSTFFYSSSPYIPSCSQCRVKIVWVTPVGWESRIPLRVYIALR